MKKEKSIILCILIAVSLLLTIGSLLYSNYGSLHSYNSHDRYSFGGGIMIRLG